MPLAEDLVTGESALWLRLRAHPFVVAAAEGSLPPSAFERWLVEDHHFVVGFRRFLAALLAQAPDEDARDVLAGGLAALTPELALFRAEAARRHLDLSGEPAPTTLGYTGHLMATAYDGWRTGLVALFGAERAYHDAWLAVRERAAAGSAYWSFIDNWSGPAFAGYVDQLATLLDREPPGEDARRAFGRVVRFELRFWDAVHLGETW